MSRGLFHSIKQEGNYIRLVTSSETPSTFDPITIKNGDEASWNMGDGTTQAADACSIVYPAASGNKDVTCYVDDISQVLNLFFVNQDIEGEFDFSELIGVGGIFQVQSNPNLTSIKCPVTSAAWTQFKAFSCDLTGTLDLSMLTGLGGLVQLQNNSNLDGILFPTSSQSITSLLLTSLALTGTLDLSGLTGLGGVIQLQVNASLTGITCPASSASVTNFQANLCDLTGTLDVSPMTGLGGLFQVQDNPNLSGITFPSVSNSFTTINAKACGLTGTIDVSGLTGISETFQLYSNSGLTSVTFPSTTNTFGNFWIYSCSLGHVDLTPMTNLTEVNNVNIRFENNGMTAAEVNEMLVDLDGMATGGFTGRSINISGTNAAPDSSSGGFDGSAAKTSLIGKSFTVTTS